MSSSTGTLDAYQAYTLERRRISNQRVELAGVWQKEYRPIEIIERIEIEESEKRRKILHLTRKMSELLGTMRTEGSKGYIIKYEEDPWGDYRTLFGLHEELISCIEVHI